MTEALKLAKPQLVEADIKKDENAKRLFMRPNCSYDVVSNKTEFKIGLSNGKEVLSVKVKGDAGYLLSEDGQTRLMEAAKSAKKLRPSLSQESIYYAMMYSLAGGKIVQANDLVVESKIAQNKGILKLKSANRLERIEAAKSIIRHEVARRIVEDPDFKKIGRPLVFGDLNKIDKAIDDYMALNHTDKFWDMLVETQTT